jgi:hypothetical protein
METPGRTVLPFHGNVYTSERPSRIPGFPTQVVVTPHKPGKARRYKSSGGVVAPVFDGVLCVAGAKIALIAIRAAVGAYEKDDMENVLQESFSSGLVVLVAAAVGTNMRLTED